MAHRAVCRPSRAAPTSSAIAAGGFTLIELLAVIVVVTLAMGVLTLNLAAMDDGARMRAAASSWRAFDAQARLHARTSVPDTGTMLLTFAEDGRRGILIIDGTDGIQNEPITQVRFAQGVRCQTRAVNGSVARGIRIDRGGRSVDYWLVVSRAGPHQVQDVSRWLVHGLTGQMVHSRDEEGP